MSLDFDGDVLFVASFHTPEAKEVLLKEWTNPNKSCYDAIQELNKKAGKPHTREMTLQEYNITKFAPWTKETHAAMVANATGVKSHTGPVIALAYNIMRIIENSDVKSDQKTNCAIELFLDKVGNSVFKQKHGVKSLHDIVIDAICTCDIETLVAEGFKRGTSTIICDVIRKKAARHGILDLVGYHEKIKINGGSNIINLIVRRENMVYFASRALLEGCELLRHLEQPAVDVPSRMLQWTLSCKADLMKTPLESFLEKRGVEIIKSQNIREAAKDLIELFEKMMTEKIEDAVVEEPEVKAVEEPKIDKDKEVSESIRSSLGSMRKLRRAVYSGDKAKKHVMKVRPVEVKIATKEETKQVAYTDETLLAIRDAFKSARRFDRKVFSGKAVVKNKRGVAINE
jgi:hypothetical protein